MPTAEKGKSSVSLTTALAAENGNADDDGDRGLTRGEGEAEAVLIIAALAISTASSEMLVMLWRRSRRLWTGDLRRKASPERVTRRVREEEEEEEVVSRCGKSNEADDDAALLLPATRSAKVTLPINSYAQQESNAMTKSAAWSKRTKKEMPRLEGSCGAMVRIFQENKKTRRQSSDDKGRKGLFFVRFARQSRRYCSF